jgi:hypothetical protein
MGAEPEPMPRPEPVADSAPASEAVAEPKPTQTREPDNLRRELQVTTRTARYALITAVSAAIISSVVAAGSSVYVSINQANTAEQHAVTQAVRADREKNYRDYLLKFWSFVDRLNLLRGGLSAHQPVESVRSEINELSRGLLELKTAGELLVMEGSPAMGNITPEILKAVLSFYSDHLEPFVTRYTALPNAPGANDSAGWEKDSAALVSAIDDLDNKLAHFGDTFVDQGSKDLQQPG